MYLLLTFLGSFNYYQLLPPLNYGLCIRLATGVSGIASIGLVINFIQSIRHAVIIDDRDIVQTAITF